MDICQFSFQVLLNHLPNAVIFLYAKETCYFNTLLYRKKNIGRNFGLQFQSMELRTHLWWQSLSFLYLAENSWGKQLSSTSLSQEIKIMITDHQLPFDWSTSAFDAFSSVNRSWPEARPPSHLLLQVQNDGREQRPKGDPWAVLPEATLGRHIHLLS